MAGSTEDDASGAGEPDELGSLGSLVPEPQSAASDDDDKIDLEALVQLSSVAPRALHVPTLRPGAAPPPPPPRARDDGERIRLPPPAPQAARADAFDDRLERARAHAFDSDHEVDREPAPPVVPRSPLRAFGLALALGFLLGIPFGAWIFGNHERASPPPVNAVAAAPSHAPERPPPTAQDTPAAPSVVAEPAAPARVAAPAPAAPAPAPSVVPVGATKALASVAHPAPGTRSPSPSAAATPNVSLVYAPAAEAHAREVPPVAAMQRVEPAHEAIPPAAPPASSAAIVERASAEAPAHSVDSMLDDALSHPTRSAAPSAPPGELPLTPSRDEVSSAMSVLLPAIRGCAMGQAGLATAGIVVQNDGRVASVSVTGAPFEGSASGRCMEGVMRRARFPHFKQPSFRVQFPFAIQ